MANSIQRGTLYNKPLVVVDAKKAIEVSALEGILDLPSVDVDQEVKSEVTAELQPPDLSSLHSKDVE